MGFVRPAVGRAWHFQDDTEPDIGLIRFLWWEIRGVDPETTEGGVWPTAIQRDDEYRDCMDAEVSARLAVMTEDRPTALKEAAYLDSRGYRRPEYQVFCSDYELCSAD